MNEQLPLKGLLNGKPFYGELPKEAKFVGYEVYPNQAPRYGTMTHPWFNYPCYETKENQDA